MTHPLIGEAMKKAAIAWVAVGEAGTTARALWCLPVDGALWLVSGPGEQAAPELAAAAESAAPELAAAAESAAPDRAAATEVSVTLRGDHGGRIVTWRAEVTKIDPSGQQWAEVVPQLAGKRLNAPTDAAGLVARWAAECAVYRLTPAGDPVEAGPSLPDRSLAAPPRDTPARRRTRAPFRLHRVRRR